VLSVRINGILAIGPSRGELKPRRAGASLVIAVAWAGTPVEPQAEAVAQDRVVNQLGPLTVADWSEKVEPRA
jgi:hypothetical protein